MAASDARWPPLKNVAWRVYFPLLDADGDPVANGAADTPDSERSIDSGNFAACSNEMVEIEVDSGLYYLDLNASEMNGDCICIICKTATAGTKTTPIVVYPVSGGFNELAAGIATLDAAVDSDSVLYLADHDKTQSDILLVDAAIDSDQVIALSDIAAVSTKIDSDALLTDADHDKTQSDIALVAGDASAANQASILSDIADLSTKVASDNLLTQSDLSDIISELVVLDAAIDSDSVLYLADHDKTQSDVLLVSDKADSDQVISLSDIAALSTKADSDQALSLADHDKTQSDISDLSAKVTSDAILAETDHDKTQSDIALVDAAIDSDSLIQGLAMIAAGSKANSDQVISLSDIAAISTKLDSDTVLADTDHDKTQSDVLLLSDKADSDQTLGVVLATGQTAAWASRLEESAGQIIEATVDTVVNTHTPTTTVFQADDITEATADHYNGRRVHFTSGVLDGQATDITDYELVGGIGQFTVTALTEAPANNDTFVIV